MIILEGEDIDDEMEEDEDLDVWNLLIYFEDKINIFIILKKII